MKPSLLVLLVSSFVAPILAQGGTDTKKAFADAVAAAQKAYEAGKLEAAEDLLHPHSAAVHDDFGAVLLRARINYDLGEFGKASTYADRAAQLDAASFDARFLSGKSLFQKAESAKGDKLASGSRIQGFYEAALVEFERAQKMKPDDAEVAAWRAESLFWLDRVPEAVAVYEALRKAKPDDPDPCLRIAHIHMKTQNEDAALKAATEGLVTKGRSTVRGDLAQVVFTVLNPRAKYAEMAAAFKAWSAAHPDDPQAYLWMGYACFMEKNVDDAIAQYQKGYEVSGKKHAGCALELGNAFAQKGDAAKAAEWYGAALRAQAEWPNYEAGPAWKLLGVSGGHAMKLDFAKAIEVLEKHALPAASNDWHVMNNLGLFYRDWADRIDRSHKSPDARAKNEKSLDYYLKASKLVVADEAAAPKDKAQVLNDTGVIYHYQLGNVEKGVEFYRQALQNDATYGDALENLGLCFNKLGKYEEAIPLFEKVLEREAGRTVSKNGLAEARKAVEKDQKPGK